MRLSELIKNKEYAAPPVSPRPAPSAPKPPPVVREDVERKIREDLEKELRAKLEKAEAESRELRAQKEEDERRRLREKEKMLEDGQKKVEQMMEDLEKSKERLSLWARQTVEDEVSKRLAEERSKLQKNLGQEKDAADHIIQELKQKVKQQEEDLKFKPAAPAPPPAAKPEPPRAYRPEGLEAPPIPSSPPVPAPPRPVPRTRKEDIPVYDLEAEEKGKRFYEDLVVRLQGIFDDVARSESLKINSLDAPLDGLIGLVSQKDAELINIVLQPYPDAHYFSYHAANCAVLSLVLGLDFEFSRNELKELAVAACLHDVGLVNVRENLDYPKQLTPELQKEVLAHPERGAEILQPYVSNAVATAVRQHHEAANGKGYPSGLEAKDILPYARIIHVVDSFEALTHERPYRKRPLEVSEATKEIIEKGRGIYDAAALKSMMGRVGLYPVTSLVELSNRQIARVLRQNRQFPLSPVVKIEFDEWGNKIKEASILNLAEHQIVHVLGPMRAVQSYSKEQIQAKKASPPARWTQLLDFVPTIAIIAVLLLLLLLVWKI